MPWWAAAFSVVAAADQPSGRVLLCTPDRRRFLAIEPPGRSRYRREVKAINPCVRVDGARARDGRLLEYKADEAFRGPGPRPAAPALPLTWTLALRATRQVLT